MAVVGIPILTFATYVAIILLFLASALYVGFRFKPLPANEIQTIIDQVNQDD